MSAPIFLLGQIAEAFGVLASNPVFGHSGEKLTGIAGLVGLAFQAAGINDADRKLLLVQIQQANAENRVLTDEEMDAWKARHAAAKSIIEGWQPGATS